MDDAATPNAAARAPLRCVACGYEIGVEHAVVCPECGTTIDARFRDVLDRRAAIERGFTRELWRHGAAWSTVVVVYAIGAGAIDPSLTTGLEAAGVMGALVAASAAPALLLALLTPAHDRRVVALAWIRSLWWVHGPWLMVGPAAAVAFGAALAGRELGMGKGPVKWILVPGAVLWLIGDAICLARAIVSFELGLVRNTVAGWRAGPRVRLLLAAMLGIVLVWALALGLGAAGGTHAAMNAVWFAGRPAW